MPPLWHPSILSFSSLILLLPWERGTRPHQERMEREGSCKRKNIAMKLTSCEWAQCCSNWWIYPFYLCVPCPHHSHLVPPGYMATCPVEAIYISLSTEMDGGRLGQGICRNWWPSMNKGLSNSEAPVPSFSSHREQWKYFPQGLNQSEGCCLPDWGQAESEQLFPL